MAVRSGLPADRADDFVIAVNEIAANAVRYGPPAARRAAGHRRPAGPAPALFRVTQDEQVEPDIPGVWSGVGAHGGGMMLTVAPRSVRPGWYAAVGGAA
jgi:hypothetical protein